MSFMVSFLYNTLALISIIIHYSNYPVYISFSFSLSKLYNINNIILYIYTHAIQNKINKKLMNKKIYFIIYSNRQLNFKIFKFVAQKTCNVYYYYESHIALCIIRVNKKKRENLWQLYTFPQWILEHIQKIYDLVLQNLHKMLSIFIGILERSHLHLSTHTRLKRFSWCDILSRVHRWFVLDYLIYYLLRFLASSIYFAIYHIIGHGEHEAAISEKYLGMASIEKHRWRRL